MRSRLIRFLIKLTIEENPLCESISFRHTRLQNQSDSVIKAFSVVGRSTRRKLSEPVKVISDINFPEFVFVTQQPIGRLL